MPRFVAFLRGVMPYNAKMADLKRCFELAGFENVKTVLASGNVAFDTRTRSDAALAREIEAAMDERLGRRFHTIVRSSRDLRAIVEAEPHAAHRLPANAKRIVTFLPGPHTGGLALPIVRDGVRVLAVSGREVFITYEPNPKGPVFMTLIEELFGSNVTTRTWDTVKRCASS